MKSLLVSVLLLVVCNASFGQSGIFEVHSKTVNVGIELGQNYSSLRGNEVVCDEYYATFKFSGGLSAEYIISNRVSVKSSFLYSVKNTTSKGKFAAFSVGWTYIGQSRAAFRYKYLEIPVVARTVIANNPNISLDLGMYYGHLLKAEVEDLDVDYRGNPRDITKEYKTGEVGFVGGLSMVVPISNKLAGNVSIQNHLGVSNIVAFKSNTFEAPIRTNSVQLLVGISLNLSNKD
ncbi:MAG: outer membrane beta-barrel protein [Bacteroidia bacterium]|nr:outer membrane beta-barrel protein [Bacteroidia bacterium]